MLQVNLLENDMTNPQTSIAANGLLHNVLHIPIKVCLNELRWTIYAFYLFCGIHGHMLVSLKPIIFLIYGGSWRHMWQVSSDNRHMDSSGPDLSCGVFIFVKYVTNDTTAEYIKVWLCFIPCIRRLGIWLISDHMQCQLSAVKSAYNKPINIHCSLWPDVKY